MNCGVYMISCEDTCGKVYVGHSQNIPGRLVQHAASVRHPSSTSYSTSQHMDTTGHRMNTDQQLVAYKSECKTHRLVVESCLMQMSDTIDNNTVSTFSADIDLLAPMILKGTPLDWEVVSKAQPSFDQRVVPMKYRKFFSNTPAVNDDNATTPGQVIIPPIPPGSRQRPITRSQAVDEDHFLSL